MKLLSILLFAAVFHAGATGYAQRITLSAENVTLNQVFSEIRKQTGYEFLYNSQMLATANKVSIQVNNASLEDVLELCFRNQPVTYSLFEKSIIVKAYRVLSPGMIAPPFMVTGKVLNEQNEPVAGATISVRGMRDGGTASDKNGDFSIRVADENAILVISFVGYAPQNFRVKRGEPIVAKLVLKLRVLEEVITTGMYKRPKESFTGSATTVTGDQLRNVNMTNVFDALKIFDPAIRIPDNVQFGSDPNRLPQINLRGTNNFPQQTTATTSVPTSGADFMANYGTNPNQPLFILDGFEVSLQKIYDLDINRIKTFTILKDASATSMYGSRAANGVIVVDTKEPAAGKLRINYSGMLQITAPDLTVYNLANSAEKLEVERLSGIYSFFENGLRPDADAVLKQNYASRLAAVKRGVNTYWLAQPVRTGVGQRHSIFLEGGDQFVRYSLDLGYNNNSGVMKNSNRNTYSGAMGMSYRYRKMLFRNTLSVVFNKANNSNYGAFSDYAKQNPYWNPYDSAGNVVKILESVPDYLNPTSFTQYYNPLYNATLHTIDNSDYTSLINATNLEWNLGRGLRVTGRIQLTRQTDEANLFLPAEHSSFASQADFTKKGSYTRTNGKFMSYEAGAQLDYSKSLGLHQIFNTTGLSSAQTSSEATRIYVEGFPNQELDQLLFGNAYPANTRPGGSANITRRVSAFNNLSYSYNSKYSLDFNISADGSSQYGVNKRFAPFWSGGVAWNIAKENFFKSYKAIDQLRIRATIGNSGSNNFAPGQGITTYQYYTDQSYRGQVGAVLTGYGNKDLQWQQTLKKNIGIDLGLLKGRLGLRIDIYRENTDNLILDVNTPTSDGISSYKSNVGQLINDGYEFNLNYFILKQNKKGAFWSVFLNGIHNKDRISSISNSLKKLNQTNDANSTSSTSADFNKQTTPQFRFLEGQSVNAIWAVRSMGIDPSNGREVFRKLNDSLTYDWDVKDKTIVGNTIAKLRGSFGTNINWKGFGLGLYFGYEFGGQIYNQTLVNKVEDADVYYQVDKRVYEGRWKNPGDNTYFHALAYNSNTGKVTTPKTLVTSRFVQDNNVVSMESISLSYQVPERFTNKLKLKNTRFTFLTNDLFRISSVEVERGLDYPFARTFTVNMSTSF